MNIQYDFSGQTAIVTGGARGIGRAIAAQLVRFGAQVWAWDVDPVELDGAQSLRVDVTKADEIARALGQTTRQSPRVDILVNNAGYLGRYQPFEQFDPCRMAPHPPSKPCWGVRGHAPNSPAHAARGTRSDRQYGLTCRQGGIAQLGSI